MHGGHDGPGLLRYCPGGMRIDVPLAVVLGFALAGAACKTPPELTSEADAAPPRAAAEAVPAAAPGVRLVEAPAQGSVETIVTDALKTASSAGRTLVVYVGAVWCEPCQRFHHAAEAGALDAELPRLTLIEFDLDRDRERLGEAGYAPKYIPLFALPGPDGRASGKGVEGGIKGDGAVAFIVPRLKEMLSE
jgi:hypothetical protein